MIWTNDGTTTHDVSADDGTFQSGPMSPGPDASPSRSRPRGPTSTAAPPTPSMTGSVTGRGRGDRLGPVSAVRRDRPRPHPTRPSASPDAFAYTGAAEIDRARGARHRRAAVRLGRDHRVRIALRADSSRGGSSPSPTPAASASPTSSCRAAAGAALPDGAVRPTSCPGHAPARLAARDARPTTTRTVAPGRRHVARGAAADEPLARRLRVLARGICVCTGSSRPAATRVTCCPVDPVAPPDLAYLAQVAQACDRLGYDAMLTPCGTGCEDAWLATAALIPLTRRIRFLVAFRPALLTPDPRRADGVDLPAALGRPAPREHRDRRGAGRARPLRRPRRQGRRATSRPASSSRSCGARGAVSRSTSPATTTRSRARRPATLPTRFPRSTSAARPTPPNGSRPATSTCTSRGANHPRMVAERVDRMRAPRRPRRAGRCASGSAST